MTTFRVIRTVLFPDLLKRNGYFTASTSTSNQESSYGRDSEGKKIKTQITTDFSPNPVLKAMLEDAGQADFDAARKQVSRVKPFAPQNATDAIAAGTLGGDPSAPSTPPPNPNGTASGRLNLGAALPDPAVSDEEIHANYVKALIEKNPDRADDLKAKFFANFPNADPNTFDNTVQ